jgi:hypothetical protein
MFLLVCYGFTQIVVFGKIFDPIRPKAHMFHCPMCIGFWVGIIVNFLFYSVDIELFNNIIIGSFLTGCMSSGVSYALCYVFGDNGINIKTS